MISVVEVVNLKKSFGDRLLIDDLSFSLPPAGIVGVVGPNGAYKAIVRQRRTLRMFLCISYKTYLFKFARCWKVHFNQNANWKRATR